MESLNRLFLTNQYENLTTARAESVKYLETHTSVVDRLNSSLRAYDHIQDLIPETFGKLFSGHIFPYNESEIELETSIHLSINCFYKSAMISLRNCLELGLIYLYYDRDDNSEHIIKSWLTSERSTPFKREIVAGLTKIPLVGRLNEYVSILDRVDALYGRLSNYLHTAGYRYSANFLSYSNVTRFKVQSLDEYVDELCSCVGTLAALFLCKYPVGLHYTPVDDKFGLNGPLGTFLNPYQVRQIKEVVDPEVLSFLEPLCLEDPEAIQLAEWVNQHSDITQEELNEQADQMDKERILRWGYRTWYRKIGATEHSTDPELKTFVERRLERLENWAKENGCYDSGTDSTNNTNTQAR